MTEAGDRRARSARVVVRLAAALVLACLLLPLVGGTMFVLAIRQRVITPANFHLDLALIRIDGAHIYLQRCSAPPWYCMPQDDHEADQDIFTLRVSVYTARNSAPVLNRQIVAVRVQPERRR